MKHAFSYTGNSQEITGECFLFQALPESLHAVEWIRNPVKKKINIRWRVVQTNQEGNKEKTFNDNQRLSSF